MRRDWLSPARPEGGQPAPDTDRHRTEGEEAVGEHPAGPGLDSVDAAPVRLQPDDQRGEVVDEDRDAVDRPGLLGRPAGRATASSFAEQALDHGLATRDELEQVAAAWLRWAASDDGWLGMLHGELVIRVCRRTSPPPTARRLAAGPCREAALQGPAGQPSWRAALAWTAVLTYCARPGATCS